MMPRRNSVFSRFFRAGSGIAGLLIFSSAAWSFQPSVGEQARGKINHVVIIVQENRTFDDIFGGQFALPPVKPNFSACPARPFAFPGADSVVPSAIAGQMQCGQFGDPRSINASHDVWQCLKNFTNNGTAAPFTTEAWMNVTSQQPSCPGRNGTGSLDTHPFSYLANNLRATYWDIAKKYVLGDHFFAVTSTSSFPGHQYIVAAQSVAKSIEPAFELIVADQPSSSTGKNSCFDQPDVQVTVPYLQENNYIGTKSVDRLGECYSNKTLAWLMDHHQPNAVPWKHFVTSQWIPPHPPTNPKGEFERIGTFDGFINITDYYQKTGTWPMSVQDLEDKINNGEMPNVSWVKPPCTQLSDHPGGVSTNDAASWVGSVVNWIGRSKVWSDTVIFVLWDDWGGFYDHVAPPPARTDRLGPGLRTPFLVISPYGVNGTVVHTQAGYGSVLKFVEDLFQLGRLTNVDRDANDLVGFFDFSKPHAFVEVRVKKPFAQSMCEGKSADPKLIDP